MAFIGEVDIDIYFGTNYDIINVPYYTSQIADDADKTLSLKGQVVWQSTWLTGLTINVDSYQDIVGAQYVRMLETLPNQAGYHWYNVLGYSQLSNKSVALIIEYDALLTMGIGNINKISGVMKRWSVDDDAPYKWYKSAEPLDQVDDPNYTYFRYKCIDNTTGANTGVTLYGFPYRMSEKPTILKYTNPGDQPTNIFMPSLETTKLRTAFKSTIGGDYYYTDGFLYYDREHFDNVVRPNLDAAIGLGYDIVSNTWGIPSTPLVTVNQMTGSESDAISSVIGGVEDIATGLPLFPTGYNNQKAADIGNYMSLYNEVTGDCVTVDCADLSTTNIRVMVNPYVSGCFAARFIGYLHDPDGYSGIVKSAGWLPINYTANIGNGASLARFNQNAQLNSIWTTYNNVERSVNAQRVGADEMFRAYNNAADVKADNSIAGLWAGAAGGVATTAGGLVIGSPGMGIGGGNSLMQSAAMAFQINPTADAAKEINMAEWTRTTMMADVTRQNAEYQRITQAAIINARGNIGQAAPPPTKFAVADMVNANAYDFVVRWTGLSGDDRKRLDDFLTAFGYNVDGYMLTDPKQLNSRTRFTFIQATNVEIYDLKIATTMVRNRDPATVTQIQNRFESGLRIWYDTPDFNYKLVNPIRKD